MGFSLASWPSQILECITAAINSMANGYLLFLIMLIFVAGSENFTKRLQGVELLQSGFLPSSIQASTDSHLSLALCPLRPHLSPTFTSVHSSPAYCPTFWLPYFISYCSPLMEMLCPSPAEEIFPDWHCLHLSFLLRNSYVTWSTDLWEPDTMLLGILLCLANMFW